MLRLLHITTVPQTLWFLRGHLTFLKAHGYWVATVAAPTRLLEQFRQSERVECFPVPMSRRITPLRDLASVAALVRLLRRTRPHIVHAHTPKGGLLGMIAARLAGVPVRVYHLHGLPLETARGLRRLLLRWSERASCALAHEVLCVSDSLREAALRERLVSAHKAHVPARGSIAGVDARHHFNPERSAHARALTRARLGIPPTAQVIGFVGRFARDKGVVELAEAWEQLREQWPDARLLLVGTPERHDPVPPQVIARLHRDERVHFVGWSLDTPPLYAAMDLLALPSYREGFPMVNAEAAAMGLPVITTRSTGCVDSVEHGVTGQLVAAGDPGALAGALARYLGSPTLRRTHGAAGRERMLRDFRPEGVWEATLAVYQGLLAARGVTGPVPLRSLPLPRAQQAFARPSAAASGARAAGPEPLAGSQPR